MTCPSRSSGADQTRVPQGLGDLKRRDWGLEIPAASGSWQFDNQPTSNPLHDVPKLELAEQRNRLTLSPCSSAWGTICQNPRRDFVGKSVSRQPPWQGRGWAPNRSRRIFLTRSARRDGAGGRGGVIARPSAGVKVKYVCDVGARGKAVEAGKIRS
jgi:hypothetical protein